MFTYMTCKQGNGYQASKLHWVFDDMPLPTKMWEFCIAYDPSFFFITYYFSSVLYAFQILLMDSLFIHFCQWLPLHRGTEDLSFLMMGMGICT